MKYENVNMHEVIRYKINELEANLNKIISSKGIAKRSRIRIVVGKVFLKIYEIGLDNRINIREYEQAIREVGENSLRKVGRYTK